MANASERADVAYDVLNRNVWSKYPAGDDRDLYLWSEDYACKAMRKFYDECIRAHSVKGWVDLYNRAIGAAMHLLEMVGNPMLPQTYLWLNLVIYESMEV